MTSTMKMSSCVLPFMGMLLAVACGDEGGSSNDAGSGGSSPMSFESNWPPGGGYAGDHYVVFGDEQGHQLEGAARQKEFQAIRDFFVAHMGSP